MSDIDQLGQSINEVVSRINSKELEPRPGRSDWARQQDALRQVSELVEKRVLDLLDEGLASIAEEDRESLRHVVASVAGAVAAVLQVSGNRSAASSLLSRAASAAGGTDVRIELEAATRDWEGFVGLAHARWLRRNGKPGRAEAELEKIARTARDPALREISQAILRAPSAIKTAPSLFTVNGCGVSLYGKRDPWPDGSYVATTYVTLLFIPVFPLASYRVVPQSDRRYLFLGRVPLWKPMRYFRRLVGMAILAVIASSVVGSWLASPAHRLDVALNKASAAEKAGRTKEAEQAYGEALAQFQGTVDAESLAPAALGWTRLRLQEIKEPFTADRVEEASRLVLRFEVFPAGARAGEPTRLLAERLKAWFGQIGEKRAEDLEAAGRVLELATRVADVPAQKKAFASERAQVGAKLAKLLAADWPLEAIAQLALLGAEPAALEPLEALEKKIESDDLLLEANDDLSAWFAAVGKQAEAAPLVARLKERLGAAQTRSKESGRQELLDGGNEAALRAAIKKSPKDLWIGYALATAQRARGDLAGAVATLEAQGSPGWLVTPSQRLLAGCYAETGQLERAEAILERYLWRRLPRFQAARKTYLERVKQLEDGLVARAKSGHLPPDMEKKLEAAPEAQRAELFTEWASQQLDKDSGLSTLRAAYQREQGVVPASVSLGMVKLRRANAEKGEARQQLLKDAERAFLSIRQEAEGTPAFHLGLGQVYHRLGKAEEGDKELSGLVARNDSALSLRVVAAYRELGLVAKGREIAKKVYEKGEAESKREAAMMMAVMATDLDDKELWLGKVGGDSFFLKLQLAETRGHRLLRDGKRLEADRELAVAAAGFARDAAHNGAASNNAALAFKARFEATGDPSHLEKAVQMLEAALRLEPDDAIVVGNLAELLEHRAVVAVLDKRIHLRSLPLERVNLSTIVANLLGGPEAAKVAAELRADPRFRRALELTRQEQVLAPGKIDAYRREWSWHSRFKDAAELAALRDRLARIEKLDTTLAEDNLKTWMDGSRDAELRTVAEVGLKALAKAREQEASHGPTLAAVSVFEADELDTLARMGDAAMARDSVAAWRRVEKAWPQLAPAGDLVAALLVQALLEAVAVSPELAKAWKEDFRAFNPVLICYRAAAASPAAREALRLQPAMQEAAALLKTLPVDELSSTGWVIAWIAGDTAMQGAVAAQLKDGQAGLNAEISQRLMLDSPHKKVEAELLAKTRGK